MKKNYWLLTDEMRDMYMPMVKEAISDMVAGKVECVDFSHVTHLSPTLLGDLLKELGYEFSYSDTNGWQVDFDFFYEHEDGTSLSVEGCCATFELRLRLV